MALAGCVTPPTHEELLGDGGALGELLQAAPAPGPELRRVAGAEASADELSFLQRVNAFESAVTGSPLMPASRVTLLVDGPATHRAQLAAIRQARHHVHLTVYILSDDEVGQRYLEALRERTRAGVRVRILFDSFGGRGADGAFREALQQAGVELHEYAPVNPAKSAEVWRLSQRNHRKILVVDGRVAFTGGANISEDYQHAPGVGSARPGWRDTHIQVEGPAVREFQRLFFETWEPEVGPIEPDPRYWPELAARGDELVRVVTRDGEDLPSTLVEPLQRLRGADGGEGREHAIYASYLIALAEARSRIWITQAYFAPNREFIRMLRAAARRGVDVRLLVSGRSDVGLLLHASRHHYARLLEDGVRIFEYEKAILHAKTAVVDGLWATVGSSNLDFRSFIHNDEANAIILGRGFGRRMEQQFEADLAEAREIRREDWRERPLRDRLRERWAMLFVYWI